MVKRYFGTDGIRGTTNKFPMTAEMAMRLGMAAATYFRKDDTRRHSVVIGKDTRLSGYMLESALMAGFTSAGMDVSLFGPLPTPAVAILTRSLRADMGVMITASHNPFQDNGIKLFGPDGQKLDDKAELEIEALMDGDHALSLAEPTQVGRAKRIDDASARYMEIVKATFPRQMRLSGLRIVIDCANGAAYHVAPAVLWELGAEVVPLNDEPNGFNINEDCGAVSPEGLAQEVVKYRADIGLALDGDADRLIVCDEKGQIIDGDQLIGVIASVWKREGRLKTNQVITTQMSNIALEQFLKTQDLEMVRTKVGDRYVVENMRKTGANVGGEQSGHIVLPDYGPTGDGLIAALQLLSVLIKAKKPASEVLRVFTPSPQLLKNVRYQQGTDPLATQAVKDALKVGEEALGANGRLFVRKSGTEPVIRVMAEGEAERVKKVVNEVCDVIKSVKAPKT
ncbi:phosphoglucosamine mutase [Woodsholea maritima]|uniref:phosphoglucosamine mutase n=1 Tax=Woodsholea maritima TaxID=240237 RepID=UPI00037D6ACE|nr:phosphoglucosamine mutase [Woodsholea maritima]